MPIGGTTGGMAGGSGVGGSGGAQGAQGTQGHQGAQGGGSVAGASIVRKFPFAFDTPGILTGAALYTPTIGDILLDAWFEIDTAWDGTSPLGDLLFDHTATVGWFQDAILGSILMSDNDGLQEGVLSATDPYGSFRRGPATLSQAIIAGNLQGASPYVLVRGVPAKFVTTDPVRVVVSQNGTTTGADPGSTMGAAVLYLVTATPA